MADIEFKLKALTDIWTGGVDGDKTKLHLTGIKGSIRWWYEALVRGLDGYACDPSNSGCHLELKEFKKHIGDGKDEQKVLEALNSQICPVCQLFGCTNWGGKIILRAEDDKKNVITNQIKRGKPFTLKFIERKKITDQEEKLINATIKLIVEYGAIGGKTVLKPSDHNCRESHHNDYGLISYQNKSIKANSLDKFTFPIKENKTDWPDLKNFWFVKGCSINRKQHNTIVNRLDKTPKSYNDTSASELHVFLGGYIKDIKDKNGVAIKNIPAKFKTQVEDRELRSDGESKKIFSFHTHPRCFGYGRTKDELREVVGLIINHIDGDYSSLDDKIKCWTEGGVK